MSHLTLLAKQAQGNNFYLAGQTEQGLDCYYYLTAKPSKLAALLAIEPGDAVRITDFGTMIAKGYGEPSATVREQMRREYGFA